MGFLRGKRGKIITFSEYKKVGAVFICLHIQGGLQVLYLSLRKMLYKILFVPEYTPTRYLNTSHNERYNRSQVNAPRKSKMMIYKKIPFCRRRKCDGAGNLMHLHKRYLLRLSRKSHYIKDKSLQLNHGNIPYFYAHSSSTTVWDFFYRRPRDTLYL